MSKDKDGLLINYDYCTGCRACEAACRQEHDFAPGLYGIKVVEIVLNKGQTYNFVPIPTDLCNLCRELVSQGNKPVCVHHCMAQVMRYGPVDELVQEMLNGRKKVLWTPQAKPALDPITGRSLKITEKE